MNKFIIAWIILCSSLVAETEPQKPEIGAGVFIITATGQKKKISESSLAVGKVEGKEIERVRAAHPAEITNRISGVFINKLGGESHFTAIRNNLSTSADYLFLENGVPTRSTGYFNHNALYEINVPQAGGLEVIKGPGSALYGSDAMHGVINVLSGEIPDERLIKIGAEYGSANWYRHLLTYGERLSEKHVFRFDLNQTFANGWRDNSEYSRHSATGQWLWTPSLDFEAKTVFSYSYVDQSSVSGLSKYDWKHNPDENYYHLPGRDIESFRLSSKMTKYLDDKAEIYFTPYFRHSTVAGLIPSWKLSKFSPTGEIWNSGFKSFGALLNYTEEFEKWQTLLVVGLDVDYSPGEYKVDEINVDREVKNGSTYYVDYNRSGVSIYDFESTYSSYSPYVHLETRPHEKLRLDFGLRYDYAKTELDQQLSGANVIDDTSVSYGQLSPKFGLIYDYADNQQLYASYRRGFRSPSVSALFAADADENSTNLKPTTINSYEIGFRGLLTEKLFYDVSVYYLDKKDDIITYRDPDYPMEFASNNGRSSRRGLELTLRYEYSDDLDFRLVSSWSKNKYEEWDLGDPAYFGAPSGTELEGNELERSPKYFQTYIVDYHPEWMKGGRLELEIINVGSYFTNSKNEGKYGGHQLVNLRAQYPLSVNLLIYGRLMNLLGRHNTAYTSSSSDTGFRPGEPRSLYVGFEYRF